MDRNEIPRDPRHLGVPSGVSKMISEPMVHSMQTVHLSSFDTNNVSKWKDARVQMTHVTKAFHLVRPKRFLSQWYIPHKPCTYLASRLAIYPKGQNELPLEPRHLVVPSGASKTICKPMVHLAQTMHLSFTDTNTFSKRKEVRSHMTHVT